MKSGVLITIALVGTPSLAAAATPPFIISGSITESDYPFEARKSATEGNADVLLTIDPNGQVADCKPTDMRTEPVLVDATCRAMRKMRFRPASDDAGKPVEGIIKQPFSWRLTNPCPKNAEANRICVRTRPKKR
jgi:periplasmic protein TonB